MFGKTFRFVLMLGVLLSAAFLAPTRASAVNYGKVMFSGGEHVEYTRVIKLANGNLFAAGNVFYGKNNSAIRSYQSTDNGLTFSFVTEFMDAAESGLAIGAETIYEYPSGSILLAYTVWDDNNQQAGEKLKVWKSTNGGVTWVFQAQLEDRTTWNWEPEFALSSDGKLQIYYSFTTVLAWNSIFNQVIARKESSDGGATWGSRITAVGDANNHMGMPRVVKASSSLYYMAFEYYQDSGAVHVISSTDGKTWPTCCGPSMQMPWPNGWMFSTPALAYVNGALIGIGKEYKSHVWGDQGNNGQVVLYSKNGGTTWKEMAAPFVIQFTGDDHDNWSPTLLPLSNSSLFMISPTDGSGRPNDIRYDTGTISTP